MGFTGENDLGLRANDVRRGELRGVVDVWVVGSEEDAGCLLSFFIGGGAGGVGMGREHVMGGIEVFGGWDVGFFVLEFPWVAITMADVEADGDATF